MPKRNEIYKCEICGQVVEVTTGAKPSLFCCGEQMGQEIEKITEGVAEKHVPVISAIEGGTRVSVGEVEHPMGEDHLIEWVEIINGSYVQRKYLSATDKPYADFYVPFSEDLKARAYCNNHGLWVNKK
jgi:superoxide reductase